MADHEDPPLSEEKIALHKQLVADLHNKTEVEETLSKLVSETEECFDEGSLKNLLRDLLTYLKPNNDYSVAVSDATRLQVLVVLSHVARHSACQRLVMEDQGVVCTALIDLLSSPSPDIQDRVAMLLHFLSRSIEASIRIVKPWALNQLVSVFVTCDHMPVLDHLTACFANLVPLDSLNIIGKQEVIDRIGYLLKSGSEHAKENAAFFICNYLSRKDTVTYMIIKSGIPEILIELLRHGMSERGKKPLLASIGMFAEVSNEIQTHNVKMGILAPIFDILMDTDTSLHEVCLDTIYAHTTGHTMNKMQLLTAGYMPVLQECAREWRTNAKRAQRALRVLASAADCRPMFADVFGMTKLALFNDVMQCGDPTMLQCCTVILLNLASDAEFRKAILNLGFVEIIKEHTERLGESKASNPVFQDFISEMEKTHISTNENNPPSGGWFSSVSSYLWTSGGALGAKVFTQTTHPETWTVTEVCDWLKRYWFSQYTETFSKHLINGALLLDLNDSDLQDLGIDDKFHRRSLLKQIEVLKSQ